MLSAFGFSLSSLGYPIRMSNGLIAYQDSLLEEVILSCFFTLVLAYIHLFKRCSDLNYSRPFSLPVKKALYPP
jgi:hypothetical protein